MFLTAASGWRRERNNKGNKWWWFHRPFRHLAHHSPARVTQSRCHASLTPTGNACHWPWTRHGHPFYYYTLEYIYEFFSHSLIFIATCANDDRRARNSIRSKTILYARCHRAIRIVFVSLFSLIAMEIVVFTAAAHPLNRYTESSASRGHKEFSSSI